MSATYSLELDSKVIRTFERICKKADLTPEEALSIYAAYCVRNDTLVFEDNFSRRSSTKKKNQRSKKADDNFFTWHNYNDPEFSPTSKRYKHVYVLGTVYEVSTFRDAVLKVHEILYSLNPMAYKTIGSKWFRASYVRRGKSDDVQPLDDSRTAYVDLHDSNRANLNHVVEVAEKMNINSSDIRFECCDR